MSADTLQYARFVCPQASSARGAALRAWCKDGRAFWQQQQRQGLSGSAVGLGLAHMLRQALLALFDTICADFAGQGQLAPVGLGVLGSLGRGEMAPFSDCDLILLTPRTDQAQVRRLADALFYPLWDAGLEVGHAVRTPAEFAQLAVEDDTVRTAAVDFCALGGDAALLEGLTQKLRAAQRSAATRRYALRSVRAWTAAGHAATIYKLQPNIKQGPGGLRELHRVWWLGRLLFKIQTWHDFLQHGLIEAHDFDVLRRGQKALFEIRLAMHWVAQRRQDELRFDLQDDVAAFLRLPEGPGQRGAADNLLAYFYRHAKAVRTVSTHLLLRCLEQLEPPRAAPSVVALEGFDRIGQTLHMHAAQQFDRDPLALLRMPRLAQRCGLQLSVRARARIAQAAPQQIGAALQQDPAAGRLFMQMLTDSTDGGATLNSLHELGILEHFLPEFAPITGLTQRDLYHVHTVDAHLVACARLVLRMLGGQATQLTAEAAQASDTPQTPERLQRLLERVVRPQVLVVAALLHDVGKGFGHGHAQRGAAMARQICARLGLESQNAQDIEWLVLEHLTLFRVSQRRDPQDEALLSRLAADIMSLERLELLVLLSYVDAQTTGPSAWNAWKFDLLYDLYERLRHVLRAGASASSLAVRAQGRLAQLADLGHEPAAFASTAALLPPRHLVAHRPELLLRQLQALQTAATAGSVVRLDDDPARLSTEVIVVCKDRAGLLADLAGVFAAWGLQIESACISTSTHHFAVDTFVLRDAQSLMHNQERRAKFSAELHAATLTKPNIQARLQERRRAEKNAFTATRRIRTRIVFDLDAIDGVSVLDVATADRVGLLHELTGALLAVGVTIVLARISTEGEQAIDAFYLVGKQSAGKLNLAERLAVQAAIDRVTSA